MTTSDGGTKDHCPVCWQVQAEHLLAALNSKEKELFALKQHVRKLELDMKGYQELFAAVRALFRLESDPESTYSQAIVRLRKAVGL